MKSVLISIQPKWCELIISGKKKIEVRKTRPKLETPFKCYIYCTKSKEIMFNVFLNEPEKEVEYLSGKVIGEFVCDDIETLRYRCDGYGDEWHEWNDGYVDYANMCLSEKELEDYLGTSNGFGWHISDLKIYDKPKELGEFYCKANCDYVNTGYCKVCTDNCKYHKGEFYHSITRPPQSYCYVEEL